MSFLYNRVERQDKSAEFKPIRCAYPDCSSYAEKMAQAIPFCATHYKLFAFLIWAFETIQVRVKAEEPEKVIVEESKQGEANGGSKETSQSNEKSNQ